MSVETRLTKDTFTISIIGDFNYLLLNDFRRAYDNKEAEQAVNISVDMHKTDTIDSSALGMLLNMQRHLNKQDKEISVFNCNKVVRKIFAITHFEKKFDIK